MQTLSEAANEFLAQRRIAVAGVSRDSKQAANLIYRRLRDHGYETFAVNPNATEVEGDPCFPDVKSIPEHVDGVVVVTPADATLGVVRDCAAAGVDHVWMHRGPGPTSVSEDAVAYCREHGIRVIPGGCPNMFKPTSDPAHRCMCALMRMTGQIPKRV